VHHFPLDRERGVLVTMLDFDTANRLDDAYDWIVDTEKGYYTAKEHLDLA
jgi:hypothetical protein